MTNAQGPKISLIDSGNTTIQLPEFVFDNIYAEMTRLNTADMQFSIDIDNLSKDKLIKVNKKCDVVAGILAPIEFKLQHTVITI